MRCRIGLRTALHMLSETKYLVYTKVRIVRTYVYSVRNIIFSCGCQIEQEEKKKLPEGAGDLTYTEGAYCLPAGSPRRRWGNRMKPPNPRARSQPDLLPESNSVVGASRDQARHKLSSEAQAIKRGTSTQARHKQSSEAQAIKRGTRN